MIAFDKNKVGQKYFSLCIGVSDKRFEELAAAGDKAFHKFVDDEKSHKNSDLLRILLDECAPKTEGEAFIVGTFYGQTVTKLDNPLAMILGGVARKKG